MATDIHLIWLKMVGIITIYINNMRFKQFLQEKSFTKQDIPKTFRVVFDLTEDTINELKSMELKGIKGISSSGEIIYDFLGIGRNAILIMKADEVLKLNKLSRFMYDNPHYFYSNNMAAMKRMYQKRITDNRGTWHNIADYLFKELNNKGIISSYDVSGNAPGQEISYTQVAKNSKVNSIKDAVKVFRKAMKEVLKGKQSSYYNFFENVLKLKDKELEKVFIDSFNKYIGPVYKSEGEWTIKNSSLKIPNNSYLYVLTYVSDEMINDYENDTLDPFLKMRHGDKIKEEIYMRNQLDNLKNYKVKYINAEKWNEIRNIHLNKKFKE